MALIQSRCGENFLTFNEEAHNYILNGNGVPGPTTFCEGGFPTSEVLVNWMVKEGAKFTTAILLRLFRDKKPKLTLGLLELLYKRSTQASKKKAKSAANAGTVVHKYAELTETGRREEAVALLDSKKDDPLYERIQNGCRKFDEWKAQNKDTIIATEAIVGFICKANHDDPSSRCLCFAGKFDRLAYRPGVGVVLSDFKTSSGIFVKQKIQLGAYAAAIRCWMGLEVDAIEILRFGKDDGDFEDETIRDKQIIQEFEEQALICRQTYKFKLKYDKRTYVKKPKIQPGVPSAVLPEEPGQVPNVYEAKIPRKPRRNSSKKAGRKAPPEAGSNSTAETLEG